MVKKHLPLSSDASERLEQMGLGMPYRPTEGIPSLPTDITDLGYEDLMDLMAEFVEWANYAGGKLALAWTDEGVAEDDLNEETARALTQARADTVTLDKAMATIDPDVVEARRVWRKAKAHRKALEALCEALDRNAALLSRELTRRTSTEPPRRRKDRGTP